MVQSESKLVRNQKLLALLNCSKRAEFEDDFAGSLAASGSISLRCTFLFNSYVSETILHINH